MARLSGQRGELVQAAAGTPREVRNQGGGNRPCFADEKIPVWQNVRPLAQMAVMARSGILGIVDRALPIRLRLAGATVSGRILASIGAFAGIMLAALVALLADGETVHTYMLVAPIGASAVLAFAVPSSPLAQPWSVIGGNCVSALVGVSVAAAVPQMGLAAAIAVGAAILGMTVTRSLHPPGGACALVMVLAFHGDGDPGYANQVWSLGASLALNSVALVVVAWVFHRVTGHSYPHRAEQPPSVPIDDDLLHPDDIRAALAEMDEVFDVTNRDLDAIFRHAQEYRNRRLARARH